MSTYSVIATGTLAILASSVSAHMKMSSPVPFNSADLDNSPLQNDGSNFPCKGIGYHITTMNNMAVGVPQTLSFIGGATHGGGSCQVSVTMDQQPTKESQWKVIHSIVGGCPSDHAGNLSGDPAGTKASNFSFSIPSGMPNGQYSLAWTWFNYEGNREMYMNCAPITVSGGGDDMTVFKSLPDMFVVNIPREQCKIPEMVNFVFPNPGESVETANAMSLGSSLVGAGCASMTVMGAGAGRAAQPSAAVPTGAPSASAGRGYAPGAASATSATIPTATSNVENTSAAGSAPTVTSASNGSPSYIIATTLVTVSAGHPAPTASYGSSKPSGAMGNTSGAGSGSCSAGRIPCTSPGDVVCIGASRFGLCDVNNCAVPQALAPGTTCSSGTISKRRVLHGRHKHRRHNPFH